MISTKSLSMASWSRRFVLWSGLGVAGVMLSTPLLAGGFYDITFNPLPQKASCVAEPVQITGSYTLKADSIPPLVAPTLDVVAVQGEIDVVAKDMRTNEGKFILNYRSTVAGTDTVEVVLRSGEKPIGRKVLRVKAKSPCTLIYRLKANLLAKAAEGPFAIHQKITLDVAGTLVSTAWDEPFKQATKGGGGVIRLTHEIPVFKAPGCRNLTTKPGKGVGFVTASAVGNADDSTIKVTFAHPEELNEDLKMAVVCDGKAKHIVSFFDLLKQIPDIGYWIEATFPQELGVQQVKIDLFELMKSRLAQGSKVDYSATLNVQRQ